MRSRGPSNGGSPARSGGSEIGTHPPRRADASVDASSAAATARLCGSWASRERSPRRISGELQAASRRGSRPCCGPRRRGPSRSRAARARPRRRAARAAPRGARASAPARHEPLEQLLLAVDAADPGRAAVLVHPADRLGRLVTLCRRSAHLRVTRVLGRLRCGSVTIPMTSSSRTRRSRRGRWCSRSSSTSSARPCRGSSARR